MNNDDLIKKTDIQKIAEAGAKIYETIKLQYEPDQNGKFLAIDIENKDVFLGNTSSEAVELARKVHPDRVFYVVKIGFSAAETLSSLASNYFFSCWLETRRPRTCSVSGHRFYRRIKNIPEKSYRVRSSNFTEIIYNEKNIL